jgi:hypothetical protein
MGRKGDRACAAGKAAPLHPNPIIAAMMAKVKLMRQQRSSRWGLAETSASRDSDGKRIPMLLGAGDLKAKHPANMPAWMKSIGGKPRTKAQKRAAKKHKAEQKKLRAIAEAAFK